MGLGVCSASDFEKTLESLSEPIVRSTVKNFIGRGNNKEVPSSLRKLVAGEAIDGTPAKEIEKTFGVSQSSISAYKNDATSTSSYNEPDEDLKSHNSEIRSEIVGAARLRLSQAINQITDEKLAEAKLRDIASVAKDMSAVIRNIKPDKNGGAPVTQFIYFAPQQRKESQYKVIDVGE